MKVLYFTFGYSPHDHRFVKAIKACGHDVYYMNMDSIDSLEQKLQPEGVQYITWRSSNRKCKPLDIFWTSKEFKEAISKIQPDIIHTGPIQDVAPVAIRSGYQPIVTMSWGSDLLLHAEKNWANKLSARRVLNRSKVLIADCQAVIRKAETFGFPKGHTVKFPWGVDLEHFSEGNNAALRKELGWEDSFIILSNRSWEPIYGVENVITSFYLARQKYPDLKLLLLGDGSLWEKIAALIDKYDLTDHVHPAGRISYKELPAYYQAADLYVSASKSDGSSVSLLEAMACGVPVLVSDIPGNHEWVTDRENGWLFNHNDVKDLANAMINARESRNKFEGIVDKSRNIVETRANWNENYKKLNIAYQMALELNQSGRH